MTDKSKIVMLKGATTPPVFCAKLMEVSDEIEHIVCAVTYKNGESHVFNSDMKVKDVVWLRWVIDQEFTP